MWNVLKHLLQSRTDNSPIDESLDSDTVNDFFSEIGMKLTTNFGQLRLPKLTVPNSTKQFVFHEININYTLKELQKLSLKIDFRCYQYRQQTFTFICISDCSISNPHF